jgi:hypothetical protein
MRHRHQTLGCQPEPGLAGAFFEKIVFAYELIHEKLLIERDSMVA